MLWVVTELEAISVSVNNLAEINLDDVCKIYMSKIPAWAMIGREGKTLTSPSTISGLEGENFNSASRQNIVTEIGDQVPKVKVKK